jgi:hypothetical protein
MKEVLKVSVPWMIGAAIGMCEGAGVKCRVLAFTLIAGDQDRTQQSGKKG